MYKIWIIFNNVTNYLVCITNLGIPISNDESTESGFAGFSCL